MLSSVILLLVIYILHAPEYSGTQTAMLGPSSAVKTKNRTNSMDNRENEDIVGKWNKLSKKWKRISDKWKTIRSNNIDANNSLSENSNTFENRDYQIDVLMEQLSSKPAQEVPGTKEVCNCGLTAPRREISGGEYAQDNQYPWVVRLWGGCPRATCGGTLVSPRVVLTAHHCTSNPFSPSTKSCDHSDGKRLAILGRTEINLNYLRKYKKSVNTIPVVEARSPPNALISLDDNESHDFALLVLKHPAKYSDKVRTICLPYPGQEFGGKMGKAAGWGRTDIPSRDPLQSTKLKTVSLEVNDKKYNHRFMFGTKLSKIDNQYQDACAGDSGGPLMYQNENGRWVLIGTVSGYGYKCKTNSVMMFEGSTDGIWNKVSEHVEWIEENIKQLNETICR